MRLLGPLAKLVFRFHAGFKFYFAEGSDECLFAELRRVFVHVGVKGGTAAAKLEERFKPLVGVMLPIELVSPTTLRPFAGCLLPTCDTTTRRVFYGALSATASQTGFAVAVPGWTIAIALLVL